MKKSYLFETTLYLALLILVFLLYLLVTTQPSVQASSWELPANQSIDYLVTGSDGTLYAFTDSDIYAISGNGSPKWKLAVPREWKVTNNWTAPLYTYVEWGQSPSIYAPYEHFGSYPVVAEDAGHLYVFLLNRSTADRLVYSNERYQEYYDFTFGGKENYHPCDSVIMAISPEGQPEWEYPVVMPIYKRDTSDSAAAGSISTASSSLLNARDGRVYYFHDSSVDVLSDEGKLLFTLQNASGQAAVDEQGHIYTVRAIPPMQRADTSYDLLFLPYGLTMVGEDLTSIHFNPNYTLPSGVVEAHDSRGNLLWSRDLGVNASRQCYSKELWSEYNTLPVYHSGQLYVPVENGVVSMGTNGSIMWTAEIPGGASALFGPMPFDSRGNTYLEQIDVYGWKTTLYTVNPVGAVSSSPWSYNVSWTQDFPQPLHYYFNQDFPWPVTGSDGTVYLLDANTDAQNVTFGESGVSGKLEPIILRAIEVKSGTPLWNLTISPDNARFVTINQSNLVDLFPYYAGNVEKVDNYTAIIWGHPINTSDLQVYPSADIHVYPAKDLTYLSYFYAVSEWPPIPDRSRCVYEKGLYAVGRDGQVLYSYPVNGRVTQAIASNNTFYYSTGDGKIGSGGINLAAGLALTATAFLFVRFLAAGTIARARSRLDSNENRLQVLNYIVDHPGASAIDLSRDLQMNQGTIRYHLFVLTVNHKVVTYLDSGKYLRYFKNSGAFTPEEREFLALARREPVRKTLQIISERPGLSSLELADALGVSLTATHRHVGLLVEKGVVARKMEKDRGYVYTILDQYKPHVARLGGEGK